jgi:hypothetical protein
MTEAHIVVGGGRSAVAVTHALRGHGFEVIMLDVGEELEPEKAKIVEIMARQEPEHYFIYTAVPE